MEARNAELFAHQDELAALWDEAIDEAEAQQISSVDFSAFWADKRAQLDK